MASCRWRNTKCGPENFTRSLTDHGVCFTFRSPDRQPLLVASTGEGLSATGTQAEGLSADHWHRHRYTG